MKEKIGISMELRSNLKTFLVKTLEETLEGESFDPEKDFTLLGLDSISVFDFTSHLKEVIPEIPLTIFMECKNLKELEQYLMTNHEEELQSFFAKS